MGVVTEIPGELSELELWTDQRSRFDSRADVGPMTGIAERLMRFLQGDPISDFTVTSTGTADFHTVPVSDSARSVTFQVITNTIVYRLAGTTPNTGVERTAIAGTIITLYGQPSMFGFQFASSVAGNASISGTFFD